MKQRKQEETKIQPKQERTKIQPNHERAKIQLKQTQRRNMKYPCQQCKYQTNLLNSMRTHIHHHIGSSYSCKLCRFKSSARGAVASHLMQRHRNNFGESDTSTIEEFIVCHCKACGKKYNVSEFQKHLKVKHNFPSEDEAEQTKSLSIQYIKGDKQQEDKKDESKELVMAEQPKILSIQFIKEAKEQEDKTGESKPIVTEQPKVLSIQFIKEAKEEKGKKEKANELEPAPQTLHKCPSCKYETLYLGNLKTHMIKQHIHASYT